MKKASECLKDLAKVIGWKLVNEDKGFSTYEYEVSVSKYENDSYVIRILEEPNELEVYELLVALLKVLPHRLKRKVNKLIGKFKTEDFCNFAEVAIYTIEEYKKGTEYAKLYEYGKIVGINLEEKGYNFVYHLKKNKKAEILSVIEFNLPVELAPVLGKIRKIDYKIAYVKNSRNRQSDNE